jgi:glycosyltransferase involved in cell wall biosynthesis
MTGASLQHAFEQVVKVEVQAEVIAKRVVHVCGNLQPGGAERQLAYTLRGLAEQNLESIQLLCHNLTQGSDERYDFYLPAVQDAGVRVREVRRRSALTHLPAQLTNLASALPVNLITDIADLYWEFVELKPEVVHAWLDWDNVRAGLAAVVAGVPRVILSCRNLNPSHFSLYQPYMDPAYRALAQVPNVTLINNSRAGADDYADWIGIARSRITVVYNGVDFGSQCRLSAEAAAFLRQSYGIPVDAFVVGGVFRFGEEKRPILWIESAALVAREVTNAWFIIFGQGHMQHQMLRRARQLGLQERLILAGVTNDVLSGMSIMDLLFLTSRGEGLPNVLLEAQWVGTPVVTTDAGGAKEAIDPGVTGWCVAEDRPIDLARQIIALYRAAGTCVEARRHGPAFVRKQFSLAGMIAQTMKMYGYSTAADSEAAV